MEEIGNSSELSFHSSEVLLHSSDELLRSSVKNRKFPRRCMRIFQLSCKPYLM